MFAHSIHGVGATKPKNTSKQEKQSLKTSVYNMLFCKRTVVEATLAGLGVLLLYNKSDAYVKSHMRDLIRIFKGIDGQYASKPDQRNAADETVMSFLGFSDPDSIVPNDFENPSFAQPLYDQACTDADSV